VFGTEPKQASDHMLAARRNGRWRISGGQSRCADRAHRRRL